MGGLSGHMMHPHDNLSLSQREFTDICTNSIQGKYSMCEKLDGFNIHMMNWDGQIRFARNASELKTGGFGIDDIMKRFDNFRVAEIFWKGCNQIVTLLNGAMPDDFKNTGITYNIEIITEGTTNVIEYFHNIVAVHNEWLWKEVNGKYEVFKILPFYGLGHLRSESPVTYERVPYVSTALITSDIMKVFKESGLGLDSTIEDLYTKRLIHWIFININEIISYELGRDLVHRFFHWGPQKNLKEIRKNAPECLNYILESQKEIMRYCKEPLEKIVIMVGTLILEGVEEYQNMDTKYSVCASIQKRIESQPLDPYQIQRWHWTGCKVFPIEGVVIEVDGIKYKWTGPFGPINQILGKR